VLIDGIGLLVTNDPAMGAGPLGEIRDAAVAIDGDRIAWVGPASAAPEGVDGDRLDAAGGCVLPGFVDPHTHLVFAGDRSAEFAARLAGRAYDAGGIRATVAATRAADMGTLLDNAKRLAGEALKGGTTTLEVKSGYGLDVPTERRSLEVAAALGEAPVLPRVSPTFLGAHVVPPEFEGRSDDYIALVCGEMLDACTPLAEWCDVFCERGAFDPDQSRTVLVAGHSRGLGVRVHANQLAHGPGAQLAAELAAVSADHLTHLTEPDIEALASAGVVATLLPTAELCTREPPGPARRLLEAGATVALGTDCNPGTSYTTSMPFVIALACHLLRMTPAEALAAATSGGAAALGDATGGRLVPGSPADAVLLDAPSYVHLAYRPGVNLVSSVVLRGERVVQVA
jgi:imidazolonepropionase